MNHKIEEKGKDNFGNHRFVGEIANKRFTLIELPNRPNPKTGKFNRYVTSYRLWHNNKSIIVRTYSPDNDCIMSTIRVGDIETAYGDGEGGLPDDFNDSLLPDGNFDFRSVATKSPAR